MTTMEDERTPREESTRLEVVKFYSDKVNQHVYWIITFILGSFTYLSRMTNIIRFFIDEMQYSIFSSFLISCIPLLCIAHVLFYTIGRTFYWDILHTIASSLDYTRVPEGNLYSEFQSQTNRKLKDLYENSKYSYDKKWKIAFFVNKWKLWIFATSLIYPGLATCFIIGEQIVRVAVMCASATYA